MRMLY